MKGLRESPQALLFVYGGGMCQKLRVSIMVGLVVCVIGTTACAAGAVVSQIVAAQPSAEAQHRVLKKELSSVNMVLEASDQDLRDTLNRLVPRELYQGATAIRGLTARMLRDGSMQVQAADNFIYLTVPVAVYFGYGMFETLPFKTKLRFRVSATVRPDWQLDPVIHYTGLSDALVDEIGIGPLSIKPRSMVEELTRPVQGMLTAQVARKLQERFPLHDRAEKVWRAAQKPILLDKQYRTWLLLDPQEAFFYPLYAQRGQLRLGVGLRSYAELVVGPEPAVRSGVTPLPNLKPAFGQDRRFRVALHTDLFYRDLLEIVSPLLLDKEFTGEGRRVVVKGIELYGNGDRLVIRLVTTGSLEGVLYLTCRPVFNPQTNQFSVEDVEFDLQTTSLLLATAEWFLHGTIREAIQERLNMDLSTRVQQAREMAARALARVQLAEGLYLVGNVSEMRLHDVLVQQNKLSIQIYSEGESSVVLR